MKYTKEYNIFLSFHDFWPRFYIVTLGMTSIPIYFYQFLFGYFFSLIYGDFFSILLLFFLFILFYNFFYHIAVWFWISFIFFSNMRWPAHWSNWGILDFLMGRVSGMEISSPPRISLREEKLASVGPWEARLFIPQTNFKVKFPYL